MAKNKFLEENGGKCCNFCKHYDVWEGYCKLKKEYTHAMDNFCEKFRTCDEFKQKYKKKSKNYEQLKLL